MCAANNICKFYKTLVDKSKDPIVVHQEGKIVFANPAAAKELGYSRVNFVNTNIKKYLPDESKDMVMQLYKKRMNGEEVPSVYELSLKSKDGSIIPFEVSSEKIDYNGKPAVLATLRNITERKKAEEIVSKKYRKLKRVLNEKNFGIFETTVAGTIIYVNDSFAKLIGYDTADVLIRKKVFQLYAFPEEREELIKKLQEKGEVHNQVLTFVKADGTLDKYEATEFLQGDRITGFLWEHNMNKKEEDLIIVCSYCRKFKDQKKWVQPDEYMRSHKSEIQHTDYDFSHGICGKCKEEILKEHDIK